MLGETPYFCLNPVDLCTTNYTISQEPVDKIKNLPAHNIRAWIFGELIRFCDP